MIISSKMIAATAALTLTTYFVVKAVVLRIPATRLDKVLFISGIACGILHLLICWREQKSSKGK